MNAYQPDLFEQLTAAKFEEFDAANPRVYELFRKFSTDVKAAGHEYYSADAVLHRIRWHTSVELRSDDCVKINNNWAAFYARKLMKEYDGFKGFFRTRASKADGAAQ